MNKFKITSFSLAFAAFFLIADDTVAQKKYQAKSHFDREKWVEYIEGNMPLVISVPHGGRVVVDTLPIRDCKDAITGVDGGTIELAQAIQQYFQKTYHRVPHIILSHIARKHVDQNRELENKGTCGYLPNEKPWHTFHNYVDSAIQLASSKGSNRVMYIDLHGHGHKNQRLEIGYNLGKEDLRAALDDKFDNKSKYHSVTNLLNLEKTLSFKEMIFGEDAFGTYLVNNGLPATPSKQDLAPAKTELFFAGGDNTRRFTSAKYLNVFGLQIECDKTARSAGKREEVAKSISDSIVQYLNRYAQTTITKAKN